MTFISLFDLSKCWTLKCLLLLEHNGAVDTELIWTKYHGCVQLYIKAWNSILNWWSLTALLSDKTATSRHEKRNHNYILLTKHSILWLSSLITSTSIDCGCRNQPQPHMFCVGNSRHMINRVDFCVLIETRLEWKWIVLESYLVYGPVEILEHWTFERTKAQLDT